MYLRFVVADIHQDSGRELGVFHAIGDLREAGKLSSDEEQLHDSVVQWFDKNLRKPTRFTASKPPLYRKKNKAISWFKDGAHEHLAKIRELVATLEHHGVQIVAEPFADMPSSGIRSQR